MRGLRYGDAVTLLGGSGRSAAAVERVLGGALIAGASVGGVGVLNLLDAKSELVSLGHSLIAGLRDRAVGLSRVDRTQRLCAAHTVIVVTGFFEAFDGLGLPFALREVELGRADELRFAGAGGGGDGGLIEAIFDAEAPLPSPDVSYGQVRDQLGQWYAELANRFGRYLTGLAVWDRLSETTQATALAAVRNNLPDLAVARFEAMHRRLSIDVPEFALWVGRYDDQVTHGQLGQVRQGMALLEELLRQVASGRLPDQRRAALAAVLAAELKQPVLGAGETPAQLRIPTLGEIYIDPVFKVRVAAAGDHPSAEGWWAGVPGRDDLAGFLARHFATPAAIQLPLMVLGQPGAGKSALTRVVAARLPVTDFLCVRVPLRDVPAEASVQEQIEHAVLLATGERIAWPDLSRSAGGALPVILLDGFDEILQATGVSQSDYLEKVAVFQDREAIQDRAVAVVVTSRTAVADQARIPGGTPVVRLEPFTPEQVNRWLEVWNSVNAVTFTAHRLKPLGAAAVLRHGALASQPLLLLMLALYDAQSNSLQVDAGGEAASSLDEPGLDTTQLYERLLTAFAEREIRKNHGRASEEGVASLVQSELTRLSFAAFAMFNRNRLWVTEAELNADLAALAISPVSAASTSSTAGFRAPLTAGQELVGRFFFVQRAQAIRDERPLYTYEFLHATFGEFLIARLMLHVLDDLLARQAATILPLRPDRPDDGLLSSLLSFAPLSARGPILQFAASLAAAGGPSSALRHELIIKIFHGVNDRTDISISAYRPAAVPIPDRHALYGLNLILMATANSGQVTAGELFPHASDPANEWRRATERFQPAVDAYSWGMITKLVTARRVWRDATRDLILELANTSDTVPEPVDPYWIHKYPPGSQERRSLGYQTVGHHTLSMTYHLRCEQLDDMLRHAVAPLLATIGSTINTFAPLSEEECESVAHSLVALWLMSDLSTTTEDLVARYAKSVRTLVRAWPPGGDPSAQPAITLLLRMLARDARRLPSAEILAWSQMIANSAPITDAHRALLLDCLSAVAAETEPGRNMVKSTADQIQVAEKGGFEWDPELQLNTWLNLMERDHKTLAEQIFGPADVFLRRSPIAGIILRDTALTKRVSTHVDPEL